MTKYVESGETKRVMVQLKNGQTWLAEIGLDGKVELVKQLSDPEKGKAEPEPSDEEPEKSEEEEQDEEESEEEGEESEESEEEGELEKPMAKREVGEFDGDIDKLIEAMMHRHARAPDGDDTNPEGEKYDIPKDLLKKLKDNAFNARLSSIMLDNKYDRRVKGRTRGKLDMNRLFKVPTGSRSVFTKKESRKGKQYNVLLLVDESGSMEMDDKSWKAAEAAVFLAQAFDGLNINVAIVGFNQNVTVRKEFLSKPNYPKIYEAIGTMNWEDGYGYNNDWDALNRAYQMFDKAPKGENILIMLSDGYPASTSTPRFDGLDGKREKPPKNTGTLTAGERDQKVHLHHLVKANDHRVKSIGIGIMEGGWQIPEHEVIHDVGELKKTIIKQLKKHISRG